MFYADYIWKQSERVHVVRITYEMLYIDVLKCIR